MFDGLVQISIKILHIDVISAIHTPSEQIMLPIHPFRNRHSRLHPYTPRRQRFLRTRQLIFITARILPSIDIDVIPPRLF